ncbi:MAG: S24 family peptidase, partial [Campylobacterales bacterium]|nr:S24 family peptidase [Campylobacterales bacterium]
DGIYAIQMQGQIFIKRLQFNLDGTIDIISDNPNYSTKTFNPKDNQTPLKIIGMKTLSIQR